MSNLKGKVAIVTGGSRGIGFVIAKELVNQGCKVLICSRNRAELVVACKKIDSTLSQIAYAVTDVSKESACKKLIQYALKKFGAVDILINNAGIYGPMGLFEDNSSILWRKTIETNLFGAVFCSKYAIPLMKKSKRGKLINIAGAGVGSSKTLSRFSAYYTSKIAIVGFSELLATELIDFNIQVNCLFPGPFYTHLTKQLLSQGIKKAGKKIFDEALKQKNDTPSYKNLLELILYLCSNTSNHITGCSFSAKWDQLPKIKKTKQLNNLYKLRRIDNVMFHEK